MKFLEAPIFGRLVKRYKRFFSDVLLNDEIVVAHTPNTGPMTTCWEPDMECVLSQSNNPDRKLKYTLELTKNQDTFILVNTHQPNKIMLNHLQQKLIPGLEFDKVSSEFKIGKSRFDFYAEKDDKKYLIEVKNVSTKNKDFAIFPDTKSDRALKHIEELTELQKNGYECILVFFIGRNDCDQFRPAKEIMPNYFEACKKAYDSGVILKALEFNINPSDISFKREIPVVL